MTALAPGGWFELLGDPWRGSEWLRGLDVIAWVAAPQLNAAAL